MFTRLIKRVSSVSPRAAIAGILIVAVAATGVALFFMRGGPEIDAEAFVQPRAARIDRVDGSVGIARVDEDQEFEWAEATVNTPVTIGDRVYARGDDANASIALSGHNYVRLNPGASLDLLSLEDERTQLALRTGSGLFDVGALGPDDLYEVATPYGAVDFIEPGLYEVNVDDGNTLISVLSGLAQVVGQGGSGYIGKGEVLSLIGEVAAQALASKLEPRRAGGIVDDYYRYRHPSVYDGRYENYDDYLDDPLYYDSYDNSVSSRYVPADIAGVYDLDSYGDWSNLDGYGHCWAPRENAGWAPFRDGSWDMNEVWGPTWVSQEPWGWAPYHYGRWAFVNQRWFWVPGEVATRRDYSPAPVAFIPLRQTNQIGWVPLAPGETYVPRYYDADFQPRYLASPQVIRDVSISRTYVNLNSPSGVTVVPMRSLRRLIDPSMVAQVDAALIANNSPAVDPFAIESVRRIASKRDKARFRMNLARSEQEALNRPVIASVTPGFIRARRNDSKAFQVEEVPESRKKNKLKIDQTGQFVSGRRRDGGQDTSSQQPTTSVNAQAREQMKAELAARAEQGDKSARRGLKELRREEKRAGREQVTNEGVRQVEVQRQMKNQNREQQMTDRAQRKAARKARQGETNQQQKPPETSLRQQSQEQMGREQLKQAKKQARIQRAQKEAGIPTQMSQQQEQFKAQKRAARQQRAVLEQGNKIPTMRVDQAAREAQTREQRKAQKHIERQQRPMTDGQNKAPTMGAGQAMREAQAREQLKAQKRIERQQRAVIEQGNKIPTTRVDQAAQAQAREQHNAQKRIERQQRAVMEQAVPTMRVDQPAQAQAREQHKAQKRIERQQQASGTAQQQPAAVYASPTHSKEAAQAARRAEKMQRKGKGN